MKFSLFYNGIANTTPNEEITIEQFLEKIKTDTPLFSQIRATDVKKERDKLKSKLSYVTFGGVFSYRNANSLIKSSGYACLDVDDIGNLEEVKQQIIQNKFTHCLFTSPSGKGYKFIVKIPEVKTNEEYKQYWVSIARHYNLKDNDEGTKDICRACYLSFDSTPYFNPDSEVYTDKAELTAQSSFADNDAPKDTSRSAKEFGEVCRLAKKGLTDEEIDKQMMAFAKWSESPKQYKEITIKKAREKTDGEISLNDFLNFKTNKKGQLEFESVNIDKVADYLISQHDFRTWFGVKSDYSFNFNGKIFEQNTRGIVKVESEKLLGVYCKRNLVDEIFEKIKRKTKIDREEFEKTDENFICLDNGVWDIQNKKLLPHESKYNFQRLIPRIYNEKGTCPNWFKFLDETLYPEDIPVIQEWFGYMLYREYFIKKGVICEGEQNTGKSVLLDTAIKFIGESNKTGLSLQKITGGSDFTKLSLKDKHANIYDDLSSRDLSDGGAFKVATGGGYISGEEKFGEYQQFRSFAKQMFATNKIPPVKDNDDLAYFGRWIVLKFDNVPEKLDPFLRKKLWTEEEMSGILNWALDGLYRLLENGKFSYNKTPEEVKQMMEVSGCPLIAFSMNCLEREDDSVITKDDMFKVYSAWCEKNKRPRLSKEMLGRQLGKYCSYLLAEKHKDRIWKNAKFKSDWLKIVEKEQKQLNTDTSDTFQKHICPQNKTEEIGINNDNNMVDMCFKEVSEEPQQPKPDYLEEVQE